jgi:large subunit ribosomal protein L31
MKADIHPDYVETNVTCSCGRSFQTRSVRDSLSVELCSECHPFFTGKQRLVDTGGRVERFRKRVDAKDPAAEKRAAKKRAEDRAAAADAAKKAKVSLPKPQKRQEKKDEATEEKAAAPEEAPPAPEDAPTAEVAPEPAPEASAEATEAPAEA